MWSSPHNTGIRIGIFTPAGCIPGHYAEWLNPIPPAQNQDDARVSEIRSSVMILSMTGSFKNGGLVDDQPSNIADCEEVEQGIDVLGLAIVLVRARRGIAAATLMALFFGGLISLIIKPYFTATALILPPQQQQSSVSSLMGQLGALVGGGGASLGAKNPGDLYVGILQSRTVADQLIAKFNLASIYRTMRMDDTRAALKKHVLFEARKDGLISISVTDKSSQRASDLTNAYIDALQRMNSTLAISEAAQRRVFFDQQLNEEKDALAAAEIDLKATQERTGLIQLSVQAESIIRSIAELRAQIVSREVEIQSMRTFATDQNPDVTRIQQEISTLRQQLALLENDQQSIQPGNTQLPAGLVPKDALEYARKLREVKYHESLLDMFSKQFEAARIDEAKSAPIIQVIDHAIPPDKKSGPHRLLLILGVTSIGFGVACIWSAIRHRISELSEDADSALKLQRLKEAFRD